MNAFLIKPLLLLIFFVEINSVKVWIRNTDINNALNWDKNDIPRDCDSIYFQAQADVAAYWNLQNRVSIIELHLPETGDIIFSPNIQIKFENRAKCPTVRDLKYTRHDVKGWLDPDNWKSESKWLPHVERVPCAGESIIFPPQRTFAIQLPGILVPMGEITFDNKVFRSDSWSDFLKTELGFQIFKGADDLRMVEWRNDAGCSDNKKCICGRSSYTIKDRLYIDTASRIYEEAVCLYAMPKCKPSDCYSPVIPEGHCCGICGAVLKIEDHTNEGLNLTDIKTKVEKELKDLNFENKLQTYVGRTKDENIQVVVIAENSGNTIESHTFASILRGKLIDKKLQARILSRVSGLSFSNYLLNSISGIFFGTLMGVLVLFVCIFYIYVILPKKGFQGSGTSNSFMFARFDNTLAEENLEIGLEPDILEEPPQAFDNPMYSGMTEPKKETNERSKNVSTKPEEPESSNISDTSNTKEYSNPVYSELENAKKMEDFQINSNTDNEDEFTEIKF